MPLHWVWLANLRAVSIDQKMGLLRHFSTPGEIYSAPEDTLIATAVVSSQQAQAMKGESLEEAQRIVGFCKKQDIQILHYGEDQYPQRLRNLENPPLVLYYVGKFPDFKARPAIAAVGTRKSTPYGNNTARRICAQVSACGGILLTGGAEGIETMVLHGGLDGETPLCVVLPCGVDRVYPARNRALFQKVLKKGCLLSPFVPGEPAYKWNFERRNQILSGIANGVLLVEAPCGSGALITAEAAYRQGKDLFVVPANIDMPSFAGSNDLLRDRAKAVFCGWDVLKEYAPLYPGALSRRDPAVAEGYDDREDQVAQTPALPGVKGKTDKKPVDKGQNTQYIELDRLLSGFPETEKTVAKALLDGPKSADEIVDLTGIPAHKVLTALTMLTMRSVVRQLPGKRVTLNL